VGPAYRPWQASREVRFGDDDARAERGRKGEHVQLAKCIVPAETPRRACSMVMHWACLFRLLTASGHQKLLRTAKRSAFQLASIKFVEAKTIQNQHKHIIG
jgi:hypothetical protein